MGRFRTVLGGWREVPHLGIPAALGALAVVLLPGYLYLRQYRYVLAEPDGFLYDFSFFYGAAQRFLADPAALYADVEYLYPPLSVVLFLASAALPQWVAYLAWNGGIVALAAVCFRLALRLYARPGVEPVPAPLALGLVLLGLGSGPLFQNLKYGQVNVLVLLAGLLFLDGMRRDRPMTAALVLCGGFWLKLYPLVLAPLAWGTGRPGRLALGFALGLLGLPLVLAPVVPLALYAEFAFERFPLWAGLTSQAALNASLVGVLTRLTLPPEAALRGLEVPIPVWVGAVGTLASAVLFGGLALAHAAGRLRRETAGVIALALIPVCSTLGWEHTYLLALPLLFFALLDARGRSLRTRALTTGAALLLMMPRPPIRVLTALIEHAPRFLVDLLNARYLLVTLAMAAVVAAWSWQRPEAASTKNAPAP